MLFVVMIVIRVLYLCLLNEIFLRFAFGMLRRFLPEDKIDSSVKGMTLTADGNGAVFDVPAADLDAFLAGII